MHFAKFCQRVNNVLRAGPHGAERGGASRYGDHLTYFARHLCTNITTPFIISIIIINTNNMQCCSYNSVMFLFIYNVFYR